MSCCCSIFKITFYWSLSTAVLLCAGFVIGTSARYMGKELAYVWLLSMFGAALWYHLVAPLWRPQLKGLAASLATVTSALLGPLVIANAVGLVAYSYKQDNNVRLTAAFVLITLVFYIGVYWLCRKLRATFWAIAVPKEEDENPFSLGAQLALPPKPKRPAGILEVAGNIAAGKTTRGRVWSKAPQTRFEEENVHASLHSAFLDDNAKYGFLLQVAMRERRNAAVQRQNGDTIVMLDRSLISDYVFALWNYVAGHITQAEFDIYREEYGSTPHESLIKFLPAKQRFGLVLVCTPAEECSLRAQKRGNGDSDTTLDYLTGIAVMHYMCLLHLHNNAPKMAIHLVDGTKAVGKPSSRFNSTQSTVDGRLFDLFKRHRGAAHGLGSEQEERFEEVLNILGLESEDRADEAAWHYRLVREMKPGAKVMW